MARKVANWALELGVAKQPPLERPRSGHLGATIADAILQAGVNYKTVVYPRICRIEREYPHAAQLSGVADIVSNGAVADFLQWKHEEKISRFIRLFLLLKEENIDVICDLRRWLTGEAGRQKLRSVSGVGPKTVDYISTLVGLDRMAIDRHILRFVNSAGVQLTKYDEISFVVCYAADLIGMERRDFDAWIWRRASMKPTRSRPRHYGAHPSYDIAPAANRA